MSAHHDSALGRGLLQADTNGSVGHTEFQLGFFAAMYKEACTETVGWMVRSAMGI